MTTTDLLLEAVRTATGAPDIGYASEPAVLTGGFHAEMYRVRFSGAPAGLDRELVARISPEAHTARRDAAVQGAVADLGFPTAPIRLTIGDDSVLGRAVTLMDQLPGRPLLGDLDDLPGPVGLAKLGRRLPRTLASLSAELHSLDPEVIRDAMAPFGAPSIPELLALNVAEAEHYGRTDLARAASVLARLTARDPQVACHGDLHPFNVLVDGDRSFLIDWTVSRMAHPAFDLAFTRLMLTDTPVPMPRAAAPAIKGIGSLLANRVSHWYERMARHGIAVTPVLVARYRAVHAHRVLLEVARWDARGEQRPGHPWYALAPLAARSIEEVTTIAVGINAASAR